MTSEACPPGLACPQCGDRSRAWLLTRRCPECLHRRCSRTATVTEFSEIDLVELGRRTGLLRRDTTARVPLAGLDEREIAAEARRLESLGYRVEREPGWLVGVAGSAD